MSRIRQLMLLALVLVAAPLAQAQISPNRLPADTSCYVFWHGMSSAGASGGTNSFLRLWTDPQLAPLGQYLSSELARNKSGLRNLKQEDVAAVFSLLEAPILIAAVGPMQFSSPGANASSAKPVKPALVVMLDGKGKEDAIQRLSTRLSGDPAAPAQKPVVTPLVFGTTTIEKVAGPKNVFYRAWVGSLVLLSDQQAALEEMIQRFRAGSPSSSSLAQTAEFRQARTFLGDSSGLEFYLRIPDLGQPSAGNPGAAFLRALHLERLKAVAANLSWTSGTARIRGLAIGDFSPGSVFDAMGPAQPAFATAALASTHESFSAWRVNLAAFWETMHAGLSNSLSPAQAASMDLAEGMIGAQVGMHVPDILRLFRGELATISPAGSSDIQARLFAATIQKPDDVLRLLRTALRSLNPSETSENGVTLLRVNLPASGTAAKANVPNTIHIAIAPQMLLVAAREDQLRQGLARLASGETAGGLAADPDYLRARAKLPANLIGFSYSDLTQVDPAKGVAEFRKMMEKEAAAGRLEAKQLIEWLQKTDVSQFTHKLHRMISGSWKDSYGLYFELTVE